MSCVGGKFLKFMLASHYYSCHFISNVCKMQGFPSSVTPDYVPFQMWDSLQVGNHLFVKYFNSRACFYSKFVRGIYDLFLSGSFDLRQNDAFHPGNILTMKVNLCLDSSMLYVVLVNTLML